MFREVHLMGISCRLLSCYSSHIQYSSPASFMSSSKDSVRCIIDFASFLRKILEKEIKSLKKNGIDKEKILDNYQVNGITLRSLLPTPTIQKLSLTKTVQMFEHVFTSRSILSNKAMKTIATDFNEEDQTADKPTRLREKLI